MLPFLNIDKAEKITKASEKNKNITVLFMGLDAKVSEKKTLEYLL